MLIIQATQLNQSGNPEKEPTPQSTQINPDEQGVYQDLELLGGISFQITAADEEQASITINFPRGERDLWIGGEKSGSIMNLAIMQTASKLIYQNLGLPQDFPNTIQLTDFQLPEDCQVSLRVINCTTKEPISDMPLTLPPDFFATFKDSPLRQY